MKKTPEDYVLDIQEACKELGWSIAICDLELGVQGLIIGQLEYVEEITEQLVNGEEYEIWDRPQNENNELH